MSASPAHLPTVHALGNQVMNRKLLATAISSVLAVATGPGLAFAQAPASTTKTAEQAAADAEKERIVELQKVVVTGSLIPQAQQETASPVTTITADEIQREGYRNVSDALRAQPLATGAVQDNQFTNGFTPGATTISLLGLAPGFTLILIDGRPLADYPLLYNGQSNFTDLSSIPTGMVERIDILPGNQSAIYGSAAIAGVVNIILKKHLQGTQLSLRVGGYDDGGGDNLRFQLTGGKTWDRLDVTYGLQYSTQDPIFGYQRSWTDSTEDNPNPNARFGARTFLVADNFGATYIDPGQAACDGLSANFGGTTTREFRPGRGFYCGSRAQPGYTTFLNDETGTSVYLNANFKLSDNAELYASLLYGVNKTQTDSGSRFWVPDVNGTFGVVFDDRDESFTLYQHIFSPEETGPANQYITRSRSYNAAFGIRGTFGDSTWDYDAYYSRSQYNLKDSQMWPLTADIEDFFREQFLGPQMGTYYGYPVYNPDQAAFYQSLTPAEYASFLGEIKTESTTWTHNVNFMITNTDLFDLPAGSVGMAALVQAGYQTWSNPTDPRVINGDFWGITGTQGSGKRSNAAAAIEFRVPLLSKLTANISGRYDKYKNIDAGDDAKATYKLGLEFRPLDTLLLRGNYATAFRAPDMSYIYAGDSGFFTTATDYFRCEETNQPLDTCTFGGVNITGRRIGNLDLKSITADSYGFGVVWSPSKKFEARADYYNVSIDNEVSDLSINRLLFDENECLQGRLDPGSPTCVDALARIDRNPPTGVNPNVLRLVRINPINISQEKVTGIIAGTTFRWGGGRNGRFELGLDYNVTLDHTFTQFPGDPESDLLRDPSQSTEFKTVVSGDFVWDIGKWTTTVHGTRYGATPNCAAAVQVLGCVARPGIAPGTVAPYMLFNLNVKYQLTANSDLAVTVNNVGNRRPAVDPSYASYPFYNIFNYNAYGRAFWLQYSIDLDTD
jgi:outer membrane receptor protein involved in Fe transport